VALRDSGIGVACQSRGAHKVIDDDDEDDDEDDYFTD
jgi:hypothetical protein